MSQENVEIVRRAIDAFNQRDVDEMVRDCDPEIEVDWSRSRGPEAGIYRGQEASSAFGRTFFEMFDRVTVYSGRVHRVRRARRGAEPNALPGPGPRQGRSAKRIGCDRSQRTHRRVAALPGESRSPRSRGAVGARRSRRLLSLRDTARAMSQENVEIVRASCRRQFNRRDVDGTMAWRTEDIQMRIRGSRRLEAIYSAVRSDRSRVLRGLCAMHAGFPRSHRADWITSTLDRVRRCSCAVH